MNGWLRWSGLAVFAALVVLLSLFVWLLLDTIVESAIERTGTAVVGARVDLGSASISLAPLSFELNGLAVTNPDQPMSNAVEIDRLAGGVEALQLLRRKVIVDELAVERVRFGTQRTTSGAVDASETLVGAARQRIEGAAGALGLPAFRLPDADTILREADLESLRLAQSLQADLEGAREEWKARLAALPDKQKLEDYKARAAKIGKGDVLSSIAGGASLAKDVQRDLTALKEAAEALEAETKRFEARMGELAAAPQRDLARIEAQIGLGGDGVSGIAARILGQQAAGYVGQALEWYQRLSPMLERAFVATGEDGPEVVEPVRGKGALVRFREDDPLPDFLVRRAKVSLELEAGEVEGEIRNLTPDQPVLGKPLEVAFSSDVLPGLESLAIDGVFDHIRPGATSDHLKARVKGFAIEGFALSESAELPVTLTRGLADFDATASLKGESLHASFASSLRDAKFDVGKVEGALAEAFASALQGVDKLRVGAKVQGTLEDYDVSVESDIDRILNQALKGLAQSQLAGLEDKLRDRIDGQLEGPLAAIEQGFGGLGGFEEDLASRIELGSDALAGLGSGGGKKKKGFAVPGGIKLP